LSYSMEQNNHLIWVQLQGTRPVEIDISGMRNVNSLISNLKNLFALQTPEHLLLLEREGIALPADMELKDLSSSFMEPLVLATFKIHNSWSGKDIAYLHVPVKPMILLLLFLAWRLDAVILVAITYQWYLIHYSWSGKDNGYLQVPVKPIILLLLFLAWSPDAVMLASITFQGYLPESLDLNLLALAILCSANLLGFVAVLLNNALLLSFFIWGRFVLFIPELILDMEFLMHPVSKNRWNYILGYLWLLGCDLFVLAAVLIFKYLIYLACFYCIQKFYGSLKLPQHDDNEQEYLLHGENEQENLYQQYENEQELVLSLP